MQDLRELEEAWDALTAPVRGLIERIKEKLDDWLAILLWEVDE